MLICSRLVLCTMFLKIERRVCEDLHRSSPVATRLCDCLEGYAERSSSTCSVISAYIRHASRSSWVNGRRVRLLILWIREMTSLSKRVSGHTDSPIGASASSRFSFSNLAFLSVDQTLHAVSCNDATKVFNWRGGFAGVRPCVRCSRW